MLLTAFQGCSSMEINWNKYVGIPFVEKGRDFSGLDCWGLIRLVYMEQLGIVLPVFDEYTLEDKQVVDSLISGNMDPWKEVPEGEEQVGDGLLMELIRRPHIAVVVSPASGLMLHTERVYGARIQDYRSSEYRNRLRGFYRYVGCNRYI